MRGENLHLGPLESIFRTLASGMTFRLPVIKCPAEVYKLLEFLQSQESRVLESIFISEVKYSRPNWFVKFIANDRSFRIIKEIWNR